MPRPKQTVPRRRLDDTKKFYTDLVNAVNFLRDRKGKSFTAEAQSLLTLSATVRLGERWGSRYERTWECRAIPPFWVISLNSALCFSDSVSSFTNWPEGLPSPEKIPSHIPVQVQCDGFRCLAYKDVRDVWRDFRTGQPLGENVRPVDFGLRFE